MSSQKTEQCPQSEPENQQQAPPRIRRCRHIFIAGRQCGSPCLREEQFCYYHHNTRRPVADPRIRRARTSTYDLPTPEDRDSIRAAIAQVMHDIANNHIDLRRASLILYSLQIALCALPRENSKESQMSSIQAQSISASARSTSRRARRNIPPVSNIPAELPIEETVMDETHGLIAPETFLVHEPEQEEDLGDTITESGQPLRNSLAYKLLKEVELYEARQQGYEEARADLLKQGELYAPQPGIGIDLDAAAEGSNSPEGYVSVNHCASAPEAPVASRIHQDKNAGAPYLAQGKNAGAPHLAQGKNAGAPYLAQSKNAGAPYLAQSKNAGVPYLDSEMWVRPSREALPTAITPTLHARTVPQIRGNSHLHPSRLRARLQPCHQRRPRPAASAAEVRAAH